MKDDILIYIPLEKYVADWFIHEQGGEIPVKLIRSSIENQIIETFIQKPPKDFVPELNHQGKIPIVLTGYRHKPKESWNYLPKEAMKALCICIQNRFDICLWKEIHRFLPKYSRTKQLIFAFIEKHGIELEESTFDTIAKRYQRKRDSYYVDRCRNRKRKSQN